MDYFYREENIKHRVKFLGILLKFPINIQCQLHVSQKEGIFFTFLKANNNTIMKGLIHTINDF